MSRIYDALTKVGKKPVSRMALSRRRKNDKAGPPSLWWQQISLEWKIMATIATVMLVSGLLFMVIVSQLMGRALRAQIDQKSLAVATNLSDAATGPIIGRNSLGLYALLTKYARLQGVAYVFIEDGNGQLLAHSLRPFPPELRKSLTTDERKQVSRRVVTLQGRTVYEIRAPILEGQLGSAHLGMWGEDVEMEVNSARLTVIGIITLLLLVSIALSVLLVRGVMRPIRALTDVADEMSMDKPETPIKDTVAG
jgi:histidine kinase